MKTKSAWNPNPHQPLPTVQQDGDFPARRAAWMAWWDSPIDQTALSSMLLAKAERLQKQLTGDYETARAELESAANCDV